MAIGLLQGLAYYMLMKNNSLIDANMASSVWAAIVIIFTFTSGSAIIMWMGEQITEFGIGNGISIILFASIVSRIPNSVVTNRAQCRCGELQWMVRAADAFGCSGHFVLSVIVNDAERRTPVQYSSGSWAARCTAASHSPSHEGEHVGFCHHLLSPSPAARHHLRICAQMAGQLGNDPCV